MNRKIRIGLHALAVAVVIGLLIAIAACGPSKTTHHVSIHATPTSSTAKQAEATGKALITRCLGAQPSTTELFVLFSSHASFNQAAACFKVTNTKAFELAVRDSFTKWLTAGGFSTKEGRTAWLLGGNLVTKSGGRVPSLPEILGMYTK